MLVSFRASTPIFKASDLPPIKPAEEKVPDAVLQNVSDSKLPAEQPKKMSIFNRTREAWKDILKTFASIKSYTNGFANGVKNAVIAGSALTAIDWMVTSGIHISNKKSTLSEVLATPFVIIGKTLMKGGKFLFGGEGTKNIFSRPVGQSLKMMIWDAPKKAFNTFKNAKNVSKFGKWAAPVLAAGTLVYTTFIACLDANRKHADIDHAYGGVVGHHHKNEV